MRAIKLFSVTLTVRTDSDVEWHTVEVTAKTATAGIKLAQDAACRKHRVHSGRIEITELLLVKSSKSKVERVVEYQ